MLWDAPYHRASETWSHQVYKHISLLIQTYSEFCIDVIIIICHQSKHVWNVFNVSVDECLALKMISLNIRIYTMYHKGKQLAVSIRYLHISVKVFCKHIL